MNWIFAPAVRKTQNFQCRDTIAVGLCGTHAPDAQEEHEQGRSVSFTATVMNDSSTKGVSWSVTGAGCAGATCGVLSSQTVTSATYTAPNAVAANLSVTITATSVASSTKSAS